MDWQERLRRLDERRAGNKLTAAEYRRQRDEILAEASSRSAGPRGRVTSPMDGPTMRTTPVTPVWSPAPPPRPPGAASPPLAGEELFATAKPRRAGRRMLALFVVILFSLISGTVWWLVFRADQPSASDGSANAALTIEMLPNPTDAPLSTSGVLSVDQAVANGLASKDDAATLTGRGTEKIFYRAVVVGDTAYQIYAYQTRDPNGGKALAADLVERGRRQGMADAGITIATGVTTLRVTAPAGAILEAVYPSHGIAVRVSVSQTKQIDEAKLAAALEHAALTTVMAIPVA